MSYQSTYRSTSNPVGVYNPSPQPSVHRTPAHYSSSARSVSPLPNGTYNGSKPADYMYTPSPSTPLTPSNGIVSPSITPPSQPFYSSPVSTGATAPISSSSLLKPFDAEEIDRAMRTCFAIQTEAVNHHSKRPFAAILLGPDNKTVMCSHNSVSHYQHAESELARSAAAQFSQKYLGSCTLVSTWEPCAMCAGTVYWTGIGRVLYAASEDKLKELTGADNPENMTMSLPCRIVLGAGQRKVEVIGPVPNWEQIVVDESGKWWKDHNASQFNLTKSKTTTKDNGSIYSHRTSVSVYDPNDGLLGSIGEDGEYQADLKIDWMP